MGVLKAVGRWPAPTLAVSDKMEEEEENEKQIMTAVGVADM